ncbi:MAG: long-chain N-acyl amino acid synthase [Rhizobacter sp.]|nr:long-chain N-acyl amino acid synthase [Rhizobacter sp.]
MHHETLIGIPFDAPATSHASSQCDRASQADSEISSEISRRLYQIRIADADGFRSSASILVNKMYSTRGYSSSAVPEKKAPNKITLVATDQDTTIGTISVGYDSASGLLVDDLFIEETNALRAAGLKVCEFTKLALDDVSNSRRVLASLFHISYIYSHLLIGCDRVVIEVNPRHVGYYRRMLGFQVLGPQRLNKRVNAPAVLLSLDLEHARDQIAKFGGRAEHFSAERSLYPYFFGAEEEVGIVRRMQGRATDAQQASNPSPQRRDNFPAIHQLAA